MTEPRTKIEHLHSRIDKSDEISESDREVLLKFSNRLDLLKSEYSDHRHEKLLRHCVRIAEEVGGLSEALEDRDTAEEIVLWINRTYDNENTNHDYRTALRMFSEHVTDGEGKPDNGLCPWFRVFHISADGFPIIQLAMIQMHRFGLR